MEKENLKIKIDSEVKHIPVLLKEVLENLDVKSGDIVVDGTLGGGGYFFEFCKKVGKNGTVIGIDRDQDAIDRVEMKIGGKKKNCNYFLVKGNYRDIDKILKDLKIEKAQRIALDIGLSSYQFEESARGFSFKKNEPLLMTFTKDADSVDFTARDIVNSWDEENIADIIYGYGEERFSRRIAKAIVESREEKPIESTFDLIEIIEKAVPSGYKRQKLHFATKTFQALRIAVNDELGALKDGLEKGFESLNSGGRMVVVSFHSLEDRIVKNFIKKKKDEGVGEILIKKPITPSEDEIKNNPRSRSAKLRVVVKK